jgi:phosphohistidine phosphatase
MKRILYLVRHATAEDGSFFLDDFNRQLTPGGIIETARMGKLLFNKGVKPDCIISSSADRALQTAKIMAEQLAFDIESVVATKEIYESGPRNYMELINSLADSCEKVMIVGHNPGITFLAEYLTHTDMGNMTQCSVATVEFKDLAWAAVSARTCTLMSYDSPQQLTN